MDKYTASIWLQLVFIAVIFKAACAIRCYHCSSLSERKCGDPMSWEMLAIDCDQDIVSSTMSQVGRALPHGGSNFGNIHPPYDQTFQCFKMNIASTNPYNRDYNVNYNTNYNVRDRDNYNRDHYNRDNYNRDGYNRDNYPRDNYPRENYPRDNYNRDAYNPRDYNVRDYNNRDYNPNYNTYGYYNKTVIRGCMYLRQDGYDACMDISKRVLDPSIVQFCEVCTGEYCNGSHRLGQTSILISLLIPTMALLLARQ